MENLSFERFDRQKRDLAARRRAEVKKHASSEPNIGMIYVAGNAMDPRYYAGELLLYHLTWPPVAVDHVLVEIEEDGASHFLARRLVECTDDQVVLRQYNPDCQTVVSSKQIRNIWRALNDWLEVSETGWNFTRADVNAYIAAASSGETTHVAR